MHQDPELNALEKCFDLLNTLDPPARERVLYWLNNRFVVTQEKAVYPLENEEENVLEETIVASAVDAKSNATNGVRLSENGHYKNKDKIKIKTLEELVNHIASVTESEKALLMAAYLQTVQNQKELTGRMINDYLKKFDEGVKNITSALRVLIQKNPALIKQTFKSGNLAQSQKKYQVTKAGFDFANSLLHHYKAANQ